MPSILDRKAVAYVVVKSRDNSLLVEKAVAYAVVATRAKRLDSKKAVIYAVTKPTSGSANGDVYQDYNPYRPFYNAGLVYTVVPYIVHTVNSVERFKIQIPFTDTFTLIFLRQNLMFHEVVVSITAGEYELPQVDFNQLLIAKGNLSQPYRDAIKWSMLQRI